MHLKHDSISARENQPSTVNVRTQRPGWETAFRSPNVDQQAELFTDCFYLREIGLKQSGVLFFLAARLKPT